MRAKANEIKLAEGKIYGYISKAEFDEAMKMVEFAKKYFPRPDVFESYKIGPIFSQFLGQGKTEEALNVCKLWAKGNNKNADHIFLWQEFMKNLVIKKN